MKIHLKKLKNDERGIAAIIITVIIILVLTLIVLAMSRDASREQRQALDRQLNSQAFYAAESGIADTINYALQDNESPEEKNTCDRQDGFPSQPVLDPNGPVEYTCALYDRRPDMLVFDQILQTESEIMPIESNVGINSLTISWEETGTNGDVSGCQEAKALPPTFPKRDDYDAFDTDGNGEEDIDCSAGVLRVELLDTSSLNKNALVDNNFVAFFVPRSGGGPTIVNLDDGKGSARQGIVRAAQCVSKTDDPDRTRMCQVRISGFNLPAGDRLYMRLRSVYKDNAVTVSANDGSTEFMNAQLMVDVTGKASDVLKRLKTYIPLSDVSKYKRPEFSIHSFDQICKDITVYPPGTGGTTDNNCD